MVTDAFPAIEIRGLTKRFLNTLALDGVGLTISLGEIHALVRNPCRFRLSIRISDWLTN
jgi:ABC-type sugar transport system ATPase subunit